MKPHIVTGPVMLLLALGLAGCRSPFFHPLSDHVHNPALAMIPREDVWFKAPDGVRLHGWFLRTPGPARGTILFLHGNSENISTHIGSLAWLVGEGYQIFAFDYRGYGKSGGTPDIPGVHEDALAALEQLFRLDGVEPGRVVVFGQSLGGSIAVYAVANSPRKDDVDALIVDSGFAGYRRIIRDTLAAHVISWPLQYPLSWLANDYYSADRWIGRISPAPVVVIHGTRDATVPSRHGELLYAAAKEPKTFWVDEGGEHLTALNNEDIRRRLLAFLDSRLPVRPNSARPVSQ